MSEQKCIYTIGHSNRSLEDFISMLSSFKIELLADVRRFPASRKYPYFNKAELSEALEKEQISYLHFEDLGGRRTAAKDSQNTAWRHSAFRGYADYMETATFKTAASQLEEEAGKKLTAYMCSEAVWWSCHRSMISDYLKAAGWEVRHIMEAGKWKEHPYTAPARIENGELTYRSAPGLFDV